ncbi:hypothetical protein CASFOL_035223 [Castilleja foliolosa]|uniref:Uncharacterized protein n=1 Tax=Castilleja foliolosa TaxID=1961234 RepID=A0ABD3BNE1_9LAMI
MAPPVSEKKAIYKNFQYSTNESIGTYVVKKHDLWFNARNEMAIPNPYAAVRIVIDSLPTFWKIKADKICASLLEYDRYLDYPKIDYGKFTYLMYGEWMKQVAFIEADERYEEDPKEDSISDSTSGTGEMEI